MTSASERRERGDELAEPVDPGDAGRVERVTAGEAARADDPLEVVAADDVVELAARVGLGLLPAVAVHDHLERQADELLVDLHVVVRSASSLPDPTPRGSGWYWWMAQSKPAGTGVAVDRRVLRHDVVATFGVVVVLADLTDEDVVARA